MIPDEVNQEIERMIMMMITDSTVMYSEVNI